jgi:hypothetical protein
MIPKNAKILIEYIQSTDYGPSKWEKDFLHSIESQIETGRYLSDKQEETLMKIYEKSTGGGMYQKRQWL